MQIVTMENQNDVNCFNDTMVVAQLKEASGRVSNDLLHSRQGYTCMENSLPPLMRSQASSKIYDGPPGTLDGSLVHELGSTVTEIIKGSRLRAPTMVDAAVQALYSTKEGEDAFTRIGQLLDCVHYQQLASNSRLPVIRSQKFSSEPLFDVASGQKLHDCDKVDTRIPLELITSCVAILIMIQTCAERQYPAADVAQILDSAVTSLHPCSPRNLPVYKEIQMCMGRIKTQILALIPT